MAIPEIAQNVSFFAKSHEDKGGNNSMSSGRFDMGFSKEMGQRGRLYAQKRAVKRFCCGMSYSVAKLKKQDFVPRGNRMCF